MAQKEDERKEAYTKAVDFLYECSTPDGFIASLQDTKNYKRIWGRDSMICSIAALTTNDANLISQVKKSLLTLLKFQHKHGQIPSNVEVSTKQISYGMSTGRIDATLWFLIVFSQYVKRTKDIAFLKKYYDNYKRAYEISHLYEFNDRGFIYVPKGGDWADEYIQEGYVLYDQVLYYRAIVEFIYLRKLLHKKTEKYEKQRDRLKKLIVTNFLLDSKNKQSEFVYHSMLFEKYARQKKYVTPFLLPFFNPSGYGFRFDGMGNSLALVFNIVSASQKKELHAYIARHFSTKTHFLLPAFYPPITKRDSDWNELRNSYSYSFKNTPHNYHNGGLWPIVTAFYAISLTNKLLVGEYLDSINEANFAKKGFLFPEFLNGKTFSRKGQKKMAWSAAATIMTFNHLYGGVVFL